MPTTQPRKRAIRHGALVVLALLLTLLTALAPVPPAGADDGDWGRSVPGEFIVEVAAGASPAAVNAAVGGLGAPERLAAGSQLYRFRLDAATDPVAGVDLIKNTPGVVQAQPNVIADLPEFFGTRRLFWTDHEPPAPAPVSAYTVNQPALGNAGLPAPGPTGTGVVVAILDTGIDATHPVFANRLARGGYDFVDRDNRPAEVVNGIDDNANSLVDEAYGHGTYVAGIVRLVAPGARILPIRIIDTDGTTTAWRILQGVNRAASYSAKVVNMSLGGLDLGPIVAQNLETRANAGMVLVAAAGNEGTTDLRWPAANPGVVGVTAINGTAGTVATFANQGSWIDVAAPGVAIVSTFPAGTYATWGGTSASAPVAAGALARISQTTGTTADSDDIVNHLTATANANDLANVSAYGRIDVAAAITHATP